MLNNIEIAAAVAAVSTSESHHEHADCVRIAYEWLDAQLKIKHPRPSYRPLKHIIEKWAGRYVSQTDVEAAALLHPDIKGKYPEVNISARMTEPRVSRLAGISQAFTQDQRERHDPKSYATQEQP